MTTAVLDAPVAEMPVGKKKAVLQMPIATLMQALAKVMPAVERKTTIPILSSVLLRPASDDKSAGLEIVASDLDLSIQVTIPASKVPSVASDFPAFVLPGHKLDDYVKLLDAKKVDLSLAPEERCVTLRSGRSKTKFAVQSPANFPQTNFPEIQGGITITQDVLRRMLSFSTFAISNEEARYTMNGALLAVGGGVIRMVATDGHRMSMYTVPVESATAASGTGFGKTILPTSLLKAIAKSLDGGEADVSIEARENEIGVTIPQEMPIALTSRKLSGRFPNYEAVIPKTFALTMVVNAPAMLAALLRCATCVDERSSCIKLTISPDTIMLKGSTAETGEAEDSIDCKSDLPTFQPFSVGFVSDYLIDVAKRIGGDMQVCFATTDGQSGVMFSASPAEDETFECIVMPMRI